MTFGWYVQICWVPYINTTLDTLVGTFIYSEWAQHLFSFAGYWRGSPSLSQLIFLLKIFFI